MAHPEMKKVLIPTLTFLLLLIISFSFISESNSSPYQKKYFESLSNLEQGLKSIHSAIAGSDKKAIQLQIEKCREKLKAADIWLRYLNPVPYKQINGPLPVEWETEVFEKLEKPYKREGAGLTLAELYLEEENFSKDS